MSRTFFNRTSIASLLILALTMFGATTSWGAVDAYMTFRNKATGKSYTAKPDASGKFTFKGVAPGTYQLLFTGSPEYFTPPKLAGAHDKWIELSSFSWGTSKSVTYNVAGDGSGAAPAIITVAAGDVNGDGRADLTSIMSPRVISLANPTKDGETWSKIVMDNVTVSSTCSPSGNLAAGWDMKSSSK